MPIDLSPLKTTSRLLIEAELKVATGGGGRFQPTGFPDLGPALFRARTVPIGCSWNHRSRWQIGLSESAGLTGKAKLTA